MKLRDDLKALMVAVVAVVAIATLSGCKSQRAQARVQPIEMVWVMDLTDSVDEAAAETFLRDLLAMVDKGLCDSVTVSCIVCVNAECPIVAVDPHKPQREALREAIAQVRKVFAGDATPGSDPFTALAKSDDDILSRERVKSCRKVLLGFCDMRHEGAVNGKGFQDPSDYVFKTSDLEVALYGLDHKRLKELEAKWRKRVKRLSLHLAGERIDVDELRLPQPPPPDTRLFAQKKGEATR
jgi:hypothetical protein